MAFLPSETSFATAAWISSGFSGFVSCLTSGAGLFFSDLVCQLEPSIPFS